MMSVKDRLEAAAQHKVSGDRASATALLEGILDTAPGHGRALTALAEIRLEEGAPDQAIKLLTEVLERDRADIPARNLLASVLLARDRVDQARDLVVETLELAPGDVQSCVLRAELLMREDAPGQAEQVLRAALESNPGDPALLSALAGLFTTLSQSRAALQLAQDALAQEPDNARYQARLGRILAQLGDHEKALPHLEAAHLRLPTDPLILLFLAETQVALGLASEARVLAKRLTVRFPGLLEGWRLLIGIEALRGDTTQVLSDYLQQIRKHPDKTAAVISLAITYRSLGHLVKARELLRPFLDETAPFNAPDRHHALNVLRDCLLASDQLEDLARTLPVSEMIQRLHAPEDAAKSADTGLLLEALGQRDVLLDPTLSSLDVLVLMRFARGQRPGSLQRRIFGAAHLAPVADLAGEFSFVEIDSVAGREALAASEPPVQLTASLALSPETFRTMRQWCPYIGANADSRRTWQEALKELPRPLVALSWNASRPGLLLNDYGPVLAQADGFEGTFVSVMWDESRHQLSDWPSVIDAGTHFKSLGDLTALLAEVDLLVGPDGLPTHVAGAMGRPTALLTQPAPPWYWHSNNGAATWYPSVRVLQTGRFGHWAELMGDLAAPLQAILHSGQMAGMDVT
ncbi:tetratricopeptide repeat protein [Roseibium sp.]|uniref:tetratricopeptide repeat protein n=1 Tax=Roseibium sp. TaxID=1936156 RepID=UPI003267F10B